MSEIPKPWVPVNYKKDNGEVTVNVWGRIYTIGKKSFLQSVISQEQELLAGPVRLVGIENDEELRWEDFESFVISGSDGADITVCSSSKSEAFVVNSSVKVEYDGCIELNLSIMPQGRSVNEWFGLDGHKEPKYELSRLWLEIPIKSEVANFYQFFPNSEIKINGKKTTYNSLIQSDDLPERMELPFKAQVYLGNDDVGFGMFFESDENMHFEDADCVIEIIKSKEETVMRVHLLDCEPECWLDKGLENGKHLFPINYRIGFMATPVKEFPENPYEERNIHPDCFKKILVNYDEFLLSPFEKTGEITLDRFKRLGVKTLYLHEKWNDIQNSPLLTEETAERLKIIVSEAHKRGIKVIPYFGYEISSFSPHWGEMGKEIKRMPGEEYYDTHWYRYPWQRDLIVCYNSKWQDVLSEGIEKLTEEFGIDGIYLDGTIRPMSCANEAHGCGYRDSEGKLHATYPVWAVRELMKKLYRIVNSRGGVINAHGSAAFTLAAMPYCHSMWEGEMIQAQMMHGEIKELPEGHFRSVFQGRNFGMPMYMLCYSNPPTWTFSQALSMTLPLGILPKAVDSGEPLEIMSEIWKIIDKFNFKNAAWKPYFNNDLYKSSNDNVKVSYYENDGKYLIFIANTTECRVEAEITFGDKKLDVTEKCSSGEIICLEDKFKFKADTFAYAMVLAAKEV